MKIRERYLKFVGLGMNCIFSRNFEAINYKLIIMFHIINKLIYQMIAAIKKTCNASLFTNRLAMSNIST